jgi:predicted DNA-binding protein (MmcQ/YjbR family)
MTADELRDDCLWCLGAEETFPFGPETSVFKVAARCSRCPGSPSPYSPSALKCEPELAQQLREAHEAVTPGYHLNKRHCNTVVIDSSLPDSMISDMVEDSYDLVVSQLPKVQRKALAWRGDT